MSTLQTVNPVRKALWLRWPLSLVIVPLTLFALCLIALAIHEKLAADRIETELARIRAAGYPVDDASMAQWYLDLTSQEGTQDWAEILRLTGASEGGLVDLEQIPFVGIARSSSEIVLPEQWAANEPIAEYLRWQRPLIEKIHQATKHPTPVWQPIEFDGFATLLPDLQNSRSIVRLLRLEVEDALHHRDAKRTLRGLESMRGTVAAFDWPICMVCDLVHSALRQVHLSAIRRSLAADIWNEEQVQQLIDQVGSAQDVPQRWQSVVAGERALMMASITEHDIWQYGNSPAIYYRWLSLFPSAHLEIVDAYRSMETVGPGGLEGLSQRAETLERAWIADARKPKSQLHLPNLIYRDFMPTFIGYAKSFEHHETSRRFTLTALAIKQFQLQQGRWPDDLTQLEQIGLNPRDWQTVHGDRLGYEVANSTAYLWIYDLRDESHQIPATRPELDIEGETNDAVTTIR